MPYHWLEGKSLVREKTRVLSGRGLAVIFSRYQDNSLTVDVVTPKDHFRTFQHLNISDIYPLVMRSSLEPDIFSVSVQFFEGNLYHRLLSKH